MLNKVDYRFEPGGSLGSGQAKDVLPLDLRAILGFLRRRFFLIAGAAVACLVFGLIFLLTTPPSFTAVATMIIDAKRVELFRNDSMFEGTTLNNSVVESELQVLGSRKVAEDVVRTMDLSNNDTFMNPPRSIILSTIGGVRGFLTSLVSDQPEKTGDRFQAAVERLRDGMSASRIGQSYVIQVTYTGSDPALSAEIANVIAATYIADQLSSRFDAAERAGGWLQARVAELREKAQAADEAVQAFKAENSIFSTGGGTLLSETQVSALNAQLLAARADATQAKARLDRITEVNKGDATDLVGVDVAEGDTVTRLRQQFLDIASREREAVARYGEANPATRNLRQQRDEVQKSIQSELRRLQDVAESSYRIAESRAQALEQDLTKQMKLSTGVKRAQVKLRELESADHSYSTL